MYNKCKRQSLAVDQSFHRLIKIKYTCIRIFDVIGWCQYLLFLFFASNEAENGEQKFQKKTGKILYTNIVIYLQHLNQVV